MDFGVPGGRVTNTIAGSGDPPLDINRQIRTAFGANALDYSSAADGGPALNTILSANRVVPTRTMGNLRAGAARLKYLDLISKLLLEIRKEIS